MNSVRVIAVAVVVTAGVAAHAQDPPKITKIGFISGRPVSSSAPSTTDLVKRELRALGYIDGKNISFESRSANNKLDKLPTLATELINLRPDVLVTPSLTTALVLKNATKQIPIVIIGQGDPVAAGVIDSLARPGANVTGFIIISEILAGKRLELLKETVPKLSRVALLWDSSQGRTSSPQVWKEIQLPARDLGLQLHSMDVSSTDKLEAAFKDAIKARTTALFLGPTGIVNSNLKLIADMAIKNRLPSISERAGFVEAGGLMSYGADREEPYARAAWMIDKILKGAKPAEIPVEQPMKFEFLINLKTAKTLAVTIPPIVLMRATKVIQ